MSKLKVDLDEANIAHEGTLAALRQKHNNSMASLGEQIDGINKNKARILITLQLKAKLNMKTYCINL